MTDIVKLYEARDELIKTKFRPFIELAREIDRAAFLVQVHQHKEIDEDALFKYNYTAFLDLCERIWACR